VTILLPNKLLSAAASLPLGFALVGGAFAAEGGANAAESGPSIAILLAQVTILVLVGRLLGELMVRIGQPSILGQIIGGMLLGPAVLGTLWPEAEATLFPAVAPQQAMLSGVSELGILFLLLLAGMETDLRLALRLRKSALSVSASGIAVPFACGVTLGMLMPQDLLPDPSERLVTALFLGTALSISSLKIVATVVREMNFMRRNLGQLIIASAVIDDTVGWVIIAITFSLATSGTVDPMKVTVSVLGTLAFLALSFTLGRRVVFEIIRWTNDNLRSDLPVVTAIVAIMGVMALITEAIGVQPVLGAFVAGILIGQSPILTRQIDEQLRGLTTALFMPIFFGLTGLHADLRVLGDPETLALAGGLVLIASLGKFGGAFLGATINRLSVPESLALGFGMNARGSTEVIVASIGLSVGVLDQRLFSVIVAMAVITTLAMPPTLRWALARLPVRPEEQERLDREDFEQQSYVSQFERILTTVDDSRSGQLATRLAGAFAGLRETPVTVIDLSRRETSPKPVEPPAKPAATGEPASEEPAQRVRDSAGQGADAQEAARGERKDEVRVGAAKEEPDIAAALAAHAEKGHDLLFVGTEPTIGVERGFSSEIEAMITAFNRSAVIVSARGALRRRPDARLSLLVPVTGDALSTRAVEFAAIIAKATEGRVAAYYSPEGGGERASRRPRRGEPAQEAVFANVRRIGEHYDVEVATLNGEGRPSAILNEARSGRYTMIVLGVGARTADGLSFGPMADALLERADRSLVFFVAGDANARVPAREPTTEASETTADAAPPS
jgi:Kef-type K+ transport system membrane component KefB/nucleotide-binding universal stress UspA family protein